MYPLVFEYQLWLQRLVVKQLVAKPQCRSKVVGGVWLEPLCETSKGEAWSCAASLGLSPSPSPWKKLRLTRDWKLGFLWRELSVPVCSRFSIPTGLREAWGAVPSSRAKWHGFKGAMWKAGCVFSGGMERLCLALTWESTGRGYHGAAPAWCRAGRGDPMVGRCGLMTEDNGGCLQGLHRKPTGQSFL